MVTTGIATTRWQHTPAAGNCEAVTEPHSKPKFILYSQKTKSSLGNEGHSLTSWAQRTDPGLDGSSPLPRRRSLDFMILKAAGRDLWHSRDSLAVPQRKLHSSHPLPIILPQAWHTVGSAMGSDGLGPPHFLVG